MNRSNSSAASRVRVIATAVMFAVVSSASAGAQTADTTSIGATKTVRIPIVRTDVRWNRSSSINTTYAAPAGWQIQTFAPVEISRRQYASYSFTTVPSNYSGLSETVVQEQFKSLKEAAAQKNAAEGYQAKLNEAESLYQRAFQKTYSSHAAITVTGSVRGDNNTFSRRPGRLYLDLDVTLVRLPASKEEFERSLAWFKTTIQADSVSRR